MGHNDLKLLDCTLRDGGYVNEWKWGFHCARSIIFFLTRAKIDFVEVGFLRNVPDYNEDVTVANTIEELNRLLPARPGNTVYSAMVMRSNYDIEKLSPYSGSGIEMIRVTAHDYDIEEGMEFAREVKEKGYKLSINPINIMGYSDEKILWILKKVNEIQPYQFSIVDTFGSMKRRDFERIVSLVDNNLDRTIRVALHLHENMSLSCCLAQAFVDKRLNRPVAVDGSLMGMGRIPGNLPIELIADYCNDTAEKSYDMDSLMEAIQDYIAPLKGEAQWGYTPAYFLSARFNMHRNYAEHYLNKGDLTIRDINHILSQFDDGKKTAFDSDYADTLYESYKNNIIDDTLYINELKNKLCGRKVLVIAPGRTIETHRVEIDEFIKKKRPLVIAVNFIPETYKLDMAFFSNNRRFVKIEALTCVTITTSNLMDAQSDYRINYNRLSGAFAQGCNSFVMILKLFKELDINEVYAAGADGYSENGKNYYNSDLSTTEKNGKEFNFAVNNAIENIGVKVNYVTPSAYELNEDV